MTSQRPAKQFKRVKSSDPNRVTEIYTNTVTHIGLRNSNAHITLGVVRPNQETGQDENVVSARIVMPIETLESLVKAYGHIQTAVASQKSGTLN